MIDTFTPHLNSLLLLPLPPYTGDHSHQSLPIYGIVRTGWQPHKPLLSFFSLCKPSFRPRGYPARAKPCWVLIRTKRTKQFPDADQYLLDVWIRGLRPPVFLGPLAEGEKATRTIHQSPFPSL